MSEIDILHGQLVIGPAGSGKTTFCKAMFDLLQGLEREVIMVNLDPDNTNIPFAAAIDIGELVKLEEVMQNENLGPNGSFLYCLDMLCQNFDWLYGRIEQEFNKAKNKILRQGKTKQTKTGSENNRQKPYIIFDCPGQIELYTNYPAFKQLVNRLCNEQSQETMNPSVCKDEQTSHSISIRLVTVNVVDSFYASDAPKFISVVLNSLTSMLHLETPFINVLSKIDLIENYGKTDFGLDFYCELPDLSHLVETISNEPFLRKYKKLTESIASIIESYGLVSYAPVDVKNQELLTKILGLIDRANGFYVSNMSSNEDVLNYYRTIQADFEASKYADLL